MSFCGLKPTSKEPAMNEETAPGQSEKDGDALPFAGLAGVTKATLRGACRDRSSVGHFPSRNGDRRVGRHPQSLPSRSFAGALLFRLLSRRLAVRPRKSPRCCVVFAPTNVSRGRTFDRRWSAAFIDRVRGGSLSLFLQWSTHHVIRRRRRPSLPVRGCGASCA